MNTGVQENPVIFFSCLFQIFERDISELFVTCCLSTYIKRVINSPFTSTNRKQCYTADNT